MRTSSLTYICQKGLVLFVPNAASESAVLQVCNEGKTCFEYSP
jgi:hypothetical protein